ncbi:MAG: transposase [Methylocella sp.]
MRTLSSLVTANIEGLLRDVAIAGPAGQGLAAIAHHAGCSLVEADNEADWLARAIEVARGPDLLLLCCGRAPEAGFIEEAGDFLKTRAFAKDADDLRLRAAALKAAPENFAERLFPRLAPLVGLIAPRDLCLRAPSGRFGALARFVNPAATLRTRARRIG